MGVPLSIRLDDDVRDELEAQARAEGIGLATLLRDIATRAALDARRVRNREASASVGELVRTSVEARATGVLRGLGNAGSRCRLISAFAPARSFWRIGGETRWPRS